MVEKALLLVCIAVVALLALSSIGSQISRMMTKTECAWDGRQICIINDPNKPEM